MADSPGAQPAAAGVAPPMRHLAHSPARQAQTAIIRFLRALWRLHAGTPVSAIVSLASLAALIRSCVFTYEYYILPAWFDFWRWVEDFQRYVAGHYTFQDLIKVHNEHRIATTRLLLLLDSVAFDMNGRSTVIINLALLACVGLLVWRLVRLDGVTSRAWVAPPLFWAALLCSVCQSDNLIFAFQVQFAITCVAACCAVSLLTAGTEAKPVRAAWLSASAGLCAVAAAFSMGAGVLLTPALCILLVLRRAKISAWAAFLPVCLLGMALFFYHYPAAKGPQVHLFDGHQAVVRILYVANFLGCALNAFPDLAAYAGFCGLALFGLAFGVLARRTLARGGKLAPGDAALAALCLFVLACAAAGTVTARIYFGAAGALASRYATMSLLFVAALLGLFVRWGARSGQKPWHGAAVQLATALPILCVVNVPAYDGWAAGLRDAIEGEAQLLINNVGIEGPAPVDFLGGVPRVQGAAAFLHDRRLNMFAPENGPPAALLERLRHTSLATLPACLGAFDTAFAIDSSAFLVTGWVANPAGKRSAQWIAAIDAAGRVLGTARSVRGRPDLPVHPRILTGFEAGFRLAAEGAQGDPGQPRAIRIAGLFPGARTELCVLPGQALIGRVIIGPDAELRDAAPAQVAVQADGFVPGGEALWRIGPGAVHTLEFKLTGAGAAGSGLALPFLTADQAPPVQVRFTMTDGAVFDANAPSLWIRHGAWRAAVLPADVVQRHGGVADVRLTAQADQSLQVAKPKFGNLHEAWSKIF